MLFNDADDVSDPRRLEVTRRVFEREPDIGACGRMGAVTTGPTFRTWKARWPARPRTENLGRALGSSQAPATAGSPSS